MAEQKQPGQLVRELYDAVSKKTVEPFDELVSESMEFDNFAMDEKLKGRGAYKQYFRNWWAAFPQGHIEIRNLIESGDQVVLEIVGGGVHSGPYETPQGRIPASNRMLEFHFCQVFRVRDGKIVSGHSYSDANKLYAAPSEAKLTA